MSHLAGREFTVLDRPFGWMKNAVGIFEGVDEGRRGCAGEAAGAGLAFRGMVSAVAANGARQRF